MRRFTIKNHYNKQNVDMLIALNTYLLRKVQRGHHSLSVLVRSEVSYQLQLYFWENSEDCSRNLSRDRLRSCNKSSGFYKNRRLVLV